MAAREKKTGKKFYQPIGDRIIVERIEAEEVSQGGIIIAEVAREKPVRAVVLAVGEGKTRADGTIVPINLAVGDEILHGKYSGVDVELDRKSYLVLRTEEVLAKVVTA